MAFSRQRLKAFLLDPFPIALACGNWLAIIYSIWGENHSNTFHFVYESLFTQILFLVNLPSLVVGTVIGTTLATLLSLPGRNDFLQILSASLISGIQWFLIGKGLQTGYKQLKKTPGNQFTLTDIRSTNRSTL